MSIAGSNPALSALFFMIYFRNIICTLFLSILCSYKIDSLAISTNKINPKAILVPNYNIQKTEFKIEFLKKNRNFFVEFQVGYIDQFAGARVNVSPILKHKNFNFRINLDYLFNSDSVSYKNDWEDPFDVLNRIEYLQLSLFENKFNLFLGNINHLSFGHGYLLNNYSNNYNYPVDRNLGLKLKLNNSNNSVVYNLFFSSLEDLYNQGGLAGNHLSVLFSDSFPLRLGIGYITDLDQFLEYKNEIQNINRRIHAFEFDISFPLFQNLSKELLLIGELSAIDIPEKRYYKRVDDNEFTNDKKSRNGLWGVAFPGIKYITKNFECKLTANYNASIYSPYYLNQSQLIP